jgi:hypothetical protein
MAEITDLHLPQTKFQKNTDNLRRSLTTDLNSRPPENETRVQFAYSRRSVTRELLQT